jgi:N-methylhydantoinase A
MDYVCGVDIGGTFTDCVISTADGGLAIGKASTTPDELARGFFNSMESALRNLDTPVNEMLANAERVVHGTTVATNILVQDNGARVGLITTKGHADSVLMMRGGVGRTMGLSVERALDVAGTTKPTPLVPRRMIREVTERLDFEGDVVVGLDEEEAKAAIESLLAVGAEAICISFLWSFRNPAHEEAVVRLVEERAPDVFVSAANRIIRRSGEYERTVGTVINGIVGPSSRDYLTGVDRELREGGLSTSFLTMQAAGGLAPVEVCADNPVLTVGSGPVGGLEGARFLAAQMGIDNSIVCDMGGTSFDVGMIVDGLPVKAATHVVGRVEYSLPVVDIQSIGAGGGSIAWIDEDSGVLHIGPESAGAQPGPICYGRGGTRVTVTDADVVLGCLNPDFFLGGTMELDIEAAEAAIAALGERLRLGTMETAAGIVRVAEAQMSDLVRKVTVRRGFDPRSFAMIAYGGAGPVHAAAIAREAGIDKVIVPVGEAAGCWSALGVITADLVKVFEENVSMYEPLDPGELTARLAALEAAGRDDLRAKGVAEDRIALRRFAYMQYGYQVHQVEVPVPGEGAPLTDADLDQLMAGFESMYERLYGPGAGYRQAGIQISAVRVEAIGETGKPQLSPRRGTTAVDRLAKREIYWPTLGKVVETEVTRGSELSSGMELSGPHIVEENFTTIVIHPEQSAAVDDLGNLVITMEHQRMSRTSVPEQRTVRQ